MESKQAEVLLLCAVKSPLIYSNHDTVSRCKTFAFQSSCLWPLGPFKFMFLVGAKCCILWDMKSAFFVLEMNIFPKMWDLQGIYLGCPENYF